MSDEERIKEIEQITDDAVFKLSKLEKDRNEIIKSYIKELEEKKLTQIKSSLDLSYSNTN